MCNGKRSRQWTAREFRKVLRKNGFEFYRSNGDHEIYKRNGKIIVITGSKINSLVCWRLIRENNLEV